MPSRRPGHSPRILRTSTAFVTGSWPARPTTWRSCFGTTPTAKPRLMEPQPPGGGLQIIFTHRPEGYDPMAPENALAQDRLPERERGAGAALPAERVSTTKPRPLTTDDGLDEMDILYATGRWTPRRSPRRRSSAPSADLTRSPFSLIRTSTEERQRSSISREANDQYDQLELGVQPNGTGLAIAQP